MLEQSKAEIEFGYSDNEDCKMDLFNPGPYAKANLIFLHGGFGQIIISLTFHI